MSMAVWTVLIPTSLIRAADLRMISSPVRDQGPSLLPPLGSNNAFHKSDTN